MPYIPSNTKNRTLVYGDFDKDGTPNLDDKYPFNKKRKTQKSEVQLTNELRLIRRRGLEHRQLLQKTQSKLKRAGFKVKARIKGTTSIVNKLRRKYLYQIRDFAGVIVIVDNHEEAYQVLDYIEGNFNVVEVEDSYKTPHRTGSGYQAIHVLIEESGNYVEVQIKTLEDYKQSQISHTQYKLSDVET